MTFSLTVQGETQSSTVSPCGTYRYLLTRRWNAKPLVAYVGLNPSTAGMEAASDEDRTSGRFRAFAIASGHGGYITANLYAASATEPDDLASFADPVGPENDAAIIAALVDVTRVIVCWGTHRMAAKRAPAVLRLIVAAGHRPECLRITKHGHPEHPLYLPSALRPIPFPIPSGVLTP